MIIPNMGMKARPNPVSALFTPVQARVLGFLFGQPDRRYQSAELIRLVGAGTGAVHRQLSRLEASGLASVTRVGNQKHYQANTRAALFPELRALMVKTVAVTDPIRRALERRARGIQSAFVFGSIAKGTDTATSDVDLLVLSDSLSYSEVFEALQPAESVVGRAINPTVMTPAEWRAKRSQRDSFASRVTAQPKLFVIGSEDDVP